MFSAIQGWCASLLLALATLLFALTARAQTYTVNTVPNPRVVDGGFVTDAARLLGPAAAVIEARSRALEQSTGAELALVILPSIGDAVPKQFATALFEAWGIGKKRADNGVLIVHVLDQRRVEIETGYGVEGALPDVKCHWLIDEVVIPAFKRSQFADGHEALTRGIVYALQHPDAGRDELLNSALLRDTFAHVPAPALALTRVPSPEVPISAWVRRFLSTPFHVLPIGLLFVLGRRRTRAHHSLYPNPQKRPLAQTEILSVLVTIGWIGLVLWAGIGQLEWLHHVAAVLVAGSCVLVFRDERKTARLAAERNAPRNCPECQGALTRVRDGDAERLEPWQAIEERLGAFDYDVWSCACGQRQVHRNAGANAGVVACAACHHHTTTRARVVLRAPTQQSTGEATVTTHCEFCDHEVVEHEILSRVQPPSSSSSSSSSGSSSSSSRSFGGGRSGGGGSGGSY